jgi:transcriptional regulator with XRE-family HTH domain
MRRTLWCVTASPSAAEGATAATLGARLNFTAIHAQMKQMGLASTDIALAEITGLDRATLWRYRTDNLRPLLETAVRIADALGLPMQDIVERPPATGRPA